MSDKTSPAKTAGGPLRAIDDLPIVRSQPSIHEHGWQSWSPTTTYRIDERPIRSIDERNRLLCYRPESSPSKDVFWGEGLLAVDPASSTGGSGSTILIVSSCDLPSSGVRSGRIMFADTAGCGPAATVSPTSTSGD